MSRQRGRLERRGRASAAAGGGSLSALLERGAGQHPAGRLDEAALQLDYREPKDTGRLALLYLPDLERDKWGAKHRAGGAGFAAGVSSAATPPLNRPAPNRRLRVGYVSPDFREHAIAYAFLPLLASHDRASFEVFCYSNSRRQDHLTDQIRALADGWRDILDL